MRYIWILLLLTSATFADTATSPSTRPHELVPLISWSSDLHRSSRDWRQEALKRFDKPAIFVCHGIDTLDGKWMIIPDYGYPMLPVEEVARRMVEWFPDRQIILIICNPRGNKIDIPNVWYSRSNTWSRPRSFWDKFDHNKAIKKHKIDYADEIEDLVTGNNW